jgi:branched-chain amino acid transport system permease protein
LNTTIMLFLLQDGNTNGAIYALLGLALVLVFAVTRVILIPQGRFSWRAELRDAGDRPGPGAAWRRACAGLRCRTPR